MIFGKANIFRSNFSSEPYHEYQNSHSVLETQPSNFIEFNYLFLKKKLKCNLYSTMYKNRQKKKNLLKNDGKSFWILNNNYCKIPIKYSNISSWNPRTN